MAQEAGRRKEENPPLFPVGKSSPFRDGGSADLEDFPRGSEVTRKREKPGSKGFKKEEMVSSTEFLNPLLK